MMVLGTGSEITQGNWGSTAANPAGGLPSLLMTPALRKACSPSCRWIGDGKRGTRGALAHRRPRSGLQERQDPRALVHQMSGCLEWHRTTEPAHVPLRVLHLLPSCSFSQVPSAGLSPGYARTHLEPQRLLRPGPQRPRRTWSGAAPGLRICVGKNLTLGSDQGGGGAGCAAHLLPQIH